MPVLNLNAIAPGYGRIFNTATNAGSDYWVYIPPASTLLVAVICGYSSGSDSYLDLGNYSFSVESQAFTHLARSPQTNNSFDMAVCYLVDPVITATDGISVPFSYNISSSMTDGYMIYLAAFGDTDSTAPFVSYEIIEAPSGTPGSISSITGTVDEDYILMATLDTTGAGLTEGTLLDTNGPSAKNGGMYLRVRGEVWNGSTFAYYAGNLGASASLAAVSIKYSSSANRLLLPPVTTNTSAIYSPVVARSDTTLSATLLDNTQTIPAPRVDLVVHPSLVGSSTTLYAPTTSPGDVSLDPQRLLNTPTLYAPTCVPQAVDLSPVLVVGGQTLYGPVVAVGDVSLTTPLSTNTSSFFSPAVTTGAVSLTPSLYTNATTVYSLTVAAGAVYLTPEVWTETQSIYGLDITTGAVTLVATMRVTNNSSVYGPLMTVGDLSVSVPYTVNTQEIYLPELFVGAVALAPQFLASTQEFYALGAYLGALTLAPSSIGSVSAFFPFLVSDGALPLVVPLFGTTATIYNPTLTAVGAVLPEEVSGVVSVDIWTSSLDQGWGGVLIDEGSLIGTVDQQVWEGSHIFESWDVYIAPDWAGSVHN